MPVDPAPLSAGSISIIGLNQPYSGMSASTKGSSFIGLIGLAYPPIPPNSLPQSRHEADDCRVSYYRTPEWRLYSSSRKSEKARQQWQVAL